MKRSLFAGALAVLAVVFAVGPQVQGQGDKDKEKPKFTISEVMKKAHAKGTLRDKVIAGTASDEEKTQLTAFYVALSLSTPPPRGGKWADAQTGRSGPRPFLTRTSPAT